MFKPERNIDTTRAIVVRMAALALGIVVVVSLMLYLYKAHLSVAARTPPSPVASPVPSRIPVADFAARINLPESLPSYLDEPATLDQVADFVPDLEHEPLTFLLYRAWQERLDGLRKRIQPELTWEVLRAEPASHRGQVFRLKGRLLEPPIEENFVPGPENLFLTIYRAAIADENFNRHIVLFLDEPRGFATTDEVDVPALFLKVGSAPEGSVHGQPVVAVTFGLGQPGYLNDPAAVEQALDFDYKISDRAIWIALNQLLHLPEETLRERSRPLWEAHRKALAAPEALKGQFFWTEGSLVRLDSLERPDSPLGIEMLHMAYVVDKAEHVSICLAPEATPQLMPGHDSVKLYGMFVQVLSYTSRAGTEVRAPVLVGVHLRRIAPPKGSSITLPITLALILCGIILAIAVWVERRRDRRLAEERLRRRLSQRPEDVQQAARHAEQEAHRSRQLPPT